MPWTSGDRGISPLFDPRIAFRPYIWQHVATKREGQFGESEFSGSDSIDIEYQYLYNLLQRADARTQENPKNVPLVPVSRTNYRQFPPMNRSSDQPPSKAEASSSLPEELGQRTISSEEILAGKREVWIQHGESLYRLCETKTGKLILQK